MMALKRAFDAPSLPQLVQLIVSGKFDPIPPKLYPSQLLFLVPCLLHVGNVLGITFQNDEYFTISPIIYCKN